MKKLHTICLIAAVMALLPCAYYPFHAVNGLPIKHYLEALGGPLVALCCAGLAMLLRSPGKLLPFVLPSVALIASACGFIVASDHSHDWGHELFNECGTSRLERTLLPYYAAAASCFVAAIALELVISRQAAKVTQQDTEQSVPPNGP